MLDAVRIRAEILEEMIRQARRESGIECCGLLAGSEGVITNIFPANNALKSPTAYEIDPEELFRLFRRVREEGLDHLGLYHSHPAGETLPSARDIAQAYYPDEAYFIISPQASAHRPVRVFSIRYGKVQELKIEIVAAGE